MVREVAGGAGRRDRDPDAGPASPLANTPPVEILWQDESLVVVQKPSGLLVHRGWGRDRVTLMQLVRDRMGRRVHPVHRLDRGASGALVMALSSPVAATLAERFRSGEVEKVYLALTRGDPGPEGVIDHPIARRPGGPRVPAVTLCRRLACRGRYCLVAARPLTGRLHQIRRHLKHVSCPIIGDVNYGKGEHNRLFRREHGLHRLALHSLAIAFPHPLTDERVAVLAPVPLDLADPLARIGLLQAAREAAGGWERLFPPSRVESMPPAAPLPAPAPGRGASRGEARAGPHAAREPPRAGSTGAADPRSLPDPSGEAPGGDRDEPVREDP